MKKFLLWLAIGFAASNVAAQQNVGIGTNTPVNKLDVVGSIGTAITTITSISSIVTSATPLDATYSTILATPPASGSYNIILSPASTSKDRVYTFIYYGAAGGNTVVIKGNGADLIYSGGTGANTLSLTGGSIIVQTDGTNWYATTIASSSGGTGYIQNQTATGSFSTGQSASYSITGNGQINSNLTVGNSVGIGTTTPGANLLNVSNSAAAGGAGNGIVLDAQQGGGTSAGGAVGIAAGNGSSVGAGGVGGAVTIAGGAAAGTGNNAGGAININAGTATGTGTAGAVSINTSNGSSAANINTGASTGAVNIANGTTGGNVIAIGNTAGATSITQNVGTGNYVLNGVGASTYNVGAATTTGTITVGGTAETGPMTLGSSSGTNTLNIANGAGATTLNLANVQNGGAVNVGAGMTTGTITVGGTGAQTGTIGIGTGTGAQTLNFGTGGTGIKTINIGTGLNTSTIQLGAGTGTGASTVMVPALAVNSAVYTDANSNLTTATPSGTALGYWTESGTTIFNNPNSGKGFVGIGTDAAPTAQLQVKQAVATSGTPTAFLLNGGAHTTLAASTEATDVSFNLARIVQFATGALATQRAVRFQAPTYSFAGASIITSAATVDISGPPIAGTNATITYPAALLVESGNVGIGTTTPGSQLEIDATNPAIWLDNGGDFALAGGFVGESFHSEEFGFYNNTGAVWSGTSPATYSYPVGARQSVFGFQVGGEVGSLTNTFGATASVFRNVLDDGAGNASVSKLLTVGTNLSGDVPYVQVNTIATTNKRTRLDFSQNGTIGMEIGTDINVNNTTDMYLYNRATNSVAAYFNPGNEVWLSPRYTSSDFYMNSSGEVGIGTATPATILDIGSGNNWSLAGAGTGDVRLGATVSGTQYYLKIGVATGGTGAGDVYMAATGGGTSRLFLGSAPTSGTNYTQTMSLQNGVVGLGASSGNNFPLTGNLTFYNSGNANSVSIVPGATSTSYTMTLPTAQGTAGTVLTDNGAGVLSWSGGSGTGASGYWTRSGTDLYNTNQGDFVGIGTTSPQVGLDVETALSATFARFGSSNPVYIIANSPMVGFNAYWNGGYTYGSTNYAGIITFDQDLTAGGFSFNTAPSGTAGAAATMTSRVAITNAGNVGIGTTSPNGKLTISGPGGSNGTEGGASPTDGIEFYSTGNSTGYAGWGGRIYVDKPTGGWGTAAFIFSTPNTTNGGEIQTMTMLDGFVGIGTTAPTSPLYVTTSAASISTVNAYYGGTTAGTGWSPGLEFSGITAQGGIGSAYSAGVYGYLIGGSANSGGVVGSYSTAVYAGLGYVDAGGHADAIYANGNVIVGTGNVGIGTETPTSALSVGSSSQFQVNSTGDLVEINGLAYTAWPTAAGSAGAVLTNNGSGTLTWAGGSGGTGASGYWTRSGTDLYNTNTGDFVGIGTTTPFSKTTISLLSTNTISELDNANTAGLTIAGSDALVRLQMGVGNSTMGPYGSWIQSSFDNSASSFGNEALMLNPLGGFVGIGVSEPIAALQVLTTAQSTGTLATWGSGEFVVGLAPASGSSSGGLGLSYDGGNAVGTIYALAPGSAWKDLALRANNITFNYVGATEGMRLTTTGALAFAGAANYGNLGNQLISNGNQSPSWQALNLAGGVNYIAGLLPVANGGTGSATQNWVDLTTAQTAAGAKTWSALATFNAGITATGAVNINAGATASTTNIGTGAAAQAVNVGSTNTTSATAVNSGSGAVNVNVSNSQPTNINTGTNTGTVTIGGTATPVNIGTSTSSTVVVGNSSATINEAGTYNLNSSVNDATTINGGTSTGTVTIGGTGAQTISVGNGAAVKTVNLGSANTTSTTTILSGTSSGGAVNVNASNNSATNINTGSSTGMVTIGGGTAPVALNLGSDATGDIYYRNSSGNLARLADVAAGSTLTSGGVGAIPAWVGGSGTGASGFWTRSAGSLTPLNTGDAITTTGNISTTGSGTLTIAGASTLAALTQAGTAAINTTGSATTTIGNPSSATNIGGSETVTGLATLNGGLTSTGSININNNATTNTTNIGTGTTTGAVTIGGTGTQTINVGASGNSSGVQTVNIGSSADASDATNIYGGSTGGVSVKTLTTAGIVTTTAAGLLSSVATLPNTDLTNSTISGVALGSSLNALSMNATTSGLSGTSYNGSSPVALAVVTDNTTIAVNGSNQLYAINTGTVTSVAASNGLTSTGGNTPNITLGGTLGAATNIAQAGNDLSFTGGYVGIGTNSPAYELQVVDNVDNGNTAVISSSTNNAELVLNNTQTGGHAWTFGSTGGSAFVPSSFRIYNETTGSTDLITLTAAGLMGIGTNSPNYPLDIEVDPTVNVADGGTYGYLNSSGGEGNWTGNPISNIPVSLYSAGRIIVNGEVDVISDKRIKDIKGVSNTSSDLQTLNELEVTDYTYKDKVKNGTDERKGFIAQQVEGVYPQAVSPGNTDFIPDIYALAECADFNADEHSISITLSKAHNLVQGDKVRLITSSGKKELTVSDIISDTQFKVTGCEGPLDKVFVFGKEIHDLHVVDYDRIYTLNVSATQELAKQLAATQAKNEELECEIETLKATFNQVQSENSDLKNAKADISAVNQLQIQNNNLQKQMDELKLLMEKNGIRSEK